MFNIEEEIRIRKNQEAPKEKPIRALEHPVNARPHTNVYKMHRYYARRPWNVFEHLILHYTEPGDIILDPFFGSGTTGQVAESVGRQWIGCEINEKYRPLWEERTRQIGLSI